MSQVKVYNPNTYDPSKYDKVIFEGEPEDAKNFVVNNFPRHHGHVPNPEVYVEHDDEYIEHYYGGLWVNPADADSEVEV